jgi:hypothetical protein
MGRVLALAAVGLTIGLPATMASAQEIRNDLQQLRRDRRRDVADGRGR